MPYRVFIPVFVVAFWLAAVPARAQSNCPDANPYDSQPDDAAINACLSRGGVVTLEGEPSGGHVYYWIQHSLNITVSGTTLTVAEPGERAYLLATNDLYGPMLQTASGVNDYELSELEFGGEVYGRIYRDQCQGYRAFGSNLVLTGDGFRVHDMGTAGAMCGTALGVHGSNFEIWNVTSADNGIAENESHTAPEPWSDGHHARPVRPRLRA